MERANIDNVRGDQCMDTKGAMQQCETAGVAFNFTPGHSLRGATIYDVNTTLPARLLTGNVAENQPFGTVGPQPTINTLHSCFQILFTNILLS